MTDVKYVNHATIIADNSGMIIDLGIEGDEITPTEVSVRLGMSYQFAEFLVEQINNVLNQTKGK